MRPAQFVMSRIPDGGRLKIGANLYEYTILDSGRGIRLSENGSSLALYDFNNLPDEVKAALEIRAIESDYGGGLQRANELYHKAVRNETEKRLNAAANTAPTKTAAALQVTPITCGFELTDMGNADRLVSDYGNDLFYCPTKKLWYIWNGKHWEPDLKDKIIEIAKQRIRYIYMEAQNAPDEDTAKALAKLAYISQNGNRVREMVRLAQSDERVVKLPSELDSNPYLLSCESGTIDYLHCPREHPYREHRREDYITQFTPRNYNPTADGSKWYETLFGALPVRVIFFVQNAIGYTSIHVINEKAFFYIYGIPDGRKSSVLDPMFNALGDYTAAFDYRTFEKSYDGPGGPRADVIDLEYARGGQCSELPKNFVINDALIKSTTSANPKHVRGLFERHGHDAVLKVKLWFESNFMAKVDFEDDANFNRLNVIVFNRELPDGVIKDDKVRGFLNADPETQDAIFTWIIDGAYEYIEHGLQRPPEVNAATNQYQKMMNPLNWFLNEYCLHDPKAEVKATTLFDRFKLIAETLPKELRSAVKSELRGVKAFGKTFKKLVDHKDKNDGLYYLGITIPLTWSDDVEGIDEDIYMRTLKPGDDESGDSGNTEYDSGRSFINILAYRTFRNEHKNNHYHHVFYDQFTPYSILVYSRYSLDSLEASSEASEPKLDLSSYAARMVETLNAIKANINKGVKKRIGRELLLEGLASDLDYMFNIGSERAREVVEKLKGESQIMALVADVSVI